MTTSPQPQTFLDALVDAVQAVSAYNRQDQAPPAAVLWPDKDRMWESLLPQLRDRMPIFVLGKYSPPPAPPRSDRLSVPETQRASLVGMSAGALPDQCHRARHLDIGERAWRCSFRRLTGGNTLSRDRPAGLSSLYP